MKARILLAVAALAVAPSFASAEEVIIRDRAPEVTIERPAVTVERPAVRIEERGTVGVRDEDCKRTTVHKESSDGSSTTVRKKECD